MPRNQSEKVPHPELHADIHRYYDARFGTSGENSHRVHAGFSVEVDGQLSNMWWGAIHNELVNFYKEQRHAQRK